MIVHDNTTTKGIPENERLGIKTRTPLWMPMKDVKSDVLIVRKKKKRRTPSTKEVESEGRFGASHREDCESTAEVRALDEHPHHAGHL